MTDGKTCKDGIHWDKKMMQMRQSMTMHGRCKLSRDNSNIMMSSGCGLNTHRDFACNQLETK